MKLNHIYQGDCKDVLNDFPDASIDLLVTDPPYGYSFMNKDWDKAVVGVDTWKECLRVLKAGSFAFVMSAPRQDVLSHMIVNLGDAGFDIGFTSIYWTYACLSEDTKILTPHGWEQLRNTSNYICDKILIYNCETNKYEWESPPYWHSYRIQEDMFRIKSKDTDQLVTRNHRVLTASGFKFAENLEEQEEVVFLHDLPSNIWGVSSRNKEKTNCCGKILFNQLSSKRCYEKKTRRVAERRLSEMETRSRERMVKKSNWKKQSFLERGGNLFQEKRELWKIRDKICSLPKRVSEHGSERQLYYGASAFNGASTWASFDAIRSGAPQRSQPRKQQHRQFSVIQKQPRPQTTRARVTKEYYDGVVYCPSVSTGCFVAKRKGKMFLSGNSGFPKASNIGKLVDKRGNENYRYSDLSKELCNYLKTSREKVELSKKDVAGHFLSNTGGLTGCVWNWENGANIPTMKQWDKLKEILKLKDDKFISLIERAILKREEAEREVIGKDGRTAKDSIFNIGIQKEWDLTVSKTTQAKALDGSYAGFQPKPAVEVILVAMKPLSEKSYVDQAMKSQAEKNCIICEYNEAGKNRETFRLDCGCYMCDECLLQGAALDHKHNPHKTGGGVTWLDDCRVPKASTDRHEYGINGDEGDPTVNCYGKHNRVSYIQNSNGRFPANLLVCDDMLNDGNITKSDGGKTKRNKENKVGEWGFEDFNMCGYGDIGSFSRYFSLDAWWDIRLKQLPEGVRKTFPFLIVPKASKSEKNKGVEHFEKSIEHSTADQCSVCGGRIFQNQDRPSACKCDVPSREGKVVKGCYHPTVKPIKLMSYLIMLGSRDGDVVLDPFIGSGTTGISATINNRVFVGVERDSGFVDIAMSRIKPYMAQSRL